MPLRHYDLSAASSSAARIASMRIRCFAPASVSVTARVVRLKSVAPISSSSAAISLDAEATGRTPDQHWTGCWRARHLANSLSDESRSFIARCARGELHGIRGQREGCQDRMERGGDRHHTADGSDPKPPSPAVAKNVDCGLECGFPSVHSLLGGSMPSAARGDTREQDATTFSAGISQGRKTSSPDLSR